MAGSDLWSYCCFGNRYLLGYADPFSANAMGDKMMPTFLIVGAAKAGTTTLYKALKAHHDVFMSPMKEPHFFSFVDSPPTFTGPHDKAVNTTEVISSRAAYERLFDGSEDARAVGEASNSYLFFPDAAFQIKKTIPECKIIIMLRDPVERTFSHYRQAYALGHETLGFNEALQMEKERKRLGWRWHYQYRDQSFYADSVKRFYDLFGKGNVLIVRFKELHNLSNLMVKVYDFLGVDSSFSGFDQNAKNVTTLPKNRLLQRWMREGSLMRQLAHCLLPATLRKSLFEGVASLNKGKRFNVEMGDDLRSELKNCFSDDIERLSLLTNKDFSDWVN